MAQTVRCPHCGKTYAMKPALAGKRVRCRQCEKAFTVAAPKPADKPILATLVPEPPPPPAGNLFDLLDQELAAGPAIEPFGQAMPGPASAPSRRQSGNALLRRLQQRKVATAVAALAVVFLVAGLVIHSGWWLAIPPLAGGALAGLGLWLPARSAAAATARGLTRPPYGSRPMAAYLGCSSPWCLALWLWRGYPGIPFRVPWACRSNARTRAVGATSAPSACVSPSPCSSSSSRLPRARSPARFRRRGQHFLSRPGRSLAPEPRAALPASGIRRIDATSRPARLSTVVPLDGQRARSTARLAAKSNAASRESGDRKAYAIAAEHRRSEQSDRSRLLSPQPRGTAVGRRGSPQPRRHPTSRRTTRAVARRDLQGDGGRCPRSDLQCADSRLAGRSRLVNRRHRPACHRLAERCRPQPSLCRHRDYRQTQNPRAIEPLIALLSDVGNSQAVECLKKLGPTVEDAVLALRRRQQRCEVRHHRNPGRRRHGKGGRQTPRDCQVPGHYAAGLRGAGWRNAGRAAWTRPPRAATRTPDTPADRPAKKEKPSEPDKSDRRKPDDESLDPGQADYYEKLARRMRSDDFWVRRKAVDLLLEGEPDKAKPETRKQIGRQFCGMIQNEHGDEQHKAVRGSAMWAGKDSVPVLVKLLGRDNHFLHEEVLQALGLAGPRAAIPVANLLGDFSDHDNARECLRQMGTAAEEGLLKVVYSSNPQICLAAIELMADAGTAKCLPALRGACQPQPRGARRRQGTPSERSHSAKKSGRTKKRRREARRRKRGKGVPARMGSAE